jgi:serine/threonine-protein kinase
MDRNLSCPSLAELEEFLAGSSDEHISVHLESCDACCTQVETIRENNSLMASLARAASHWSSGSGEDPVTGEPQAPQIAGYTVEAEIHRGGQGIVYRATQQATKRPVALKVLLAGAFATTRQRQRFEREIDLVAALQHPNIVTVHDSGVSDDGKLWFAMEYIEGETLSEYFRARRDGAGRDGQPSMGGLLRLFSKVCAAVSYAHQRGVIHRDLKPGNVLIDIDGEPHVVDFGLAKPIDPKIAGDRATVTVAGGFLGTLAYASPEQISGDANLVDVRSDVYALGVMLYELLAGAFPYPVTGQLSDIVAAINHTAPKPFGARTAAHYRVDNELETIVLKTLAKAPERRYQSVEGLRRDLEHYLAGEPIDAKRDSGWYMLTKTLRRYRVQVGVVAAFGVLLVVFSASMSVLYQQARSEAEKVKQINVFLEDTLGSVEPGPGAGQEAVTVRELLDEGVHWIGLVLSDQPEIEAAVRTIIGNGYRNLGLYEEADAQLVAGLATRRELFGDDGLEVTKGLNALGLLRRDQGRDSEAQALFEESLRIRRRQLGSGHLEVAMTLANLARIMQKTGRYEEAERIQREALAIRRRRHGKMHVDVAMSEYNLAQLLAVMGSEAEARALHERSLTTRELLLHEAHPDVARSLVALGKLHLALGQHREAERWLREHLELRRRTMGGDHWRTAEARYLLGDVLVAGGRYDEAEPLLIESLELFETRFPEDGRAALIRQRLEDLRGRSANSQ